MPDPVASSRPGMGAMPFDGGVTFRVWAPHAQGVSVTGTFCDWAAAGEPLAREDGGIWSADVAAAHPGDEYRLLVRAGEELSRLDPRARQLTNSVGNAVVYDADVFDWGAGEFHIPDWNDLVIYELHVGTFSKGMHGRPGTLEGVGRRVGYLRQLGIGAIQLMPPFEFAGDRSWGYNPAYPFAVESAYGHPDDLKALVREAHEAGIAVIVDVVYNHLGPSDLDIWRFDGWCENDKGGIYFYQDNRSATPWGDTRPDYGRPEVRGFLRDNAMTWLEEFRIDGLRWDATAYISSVTGGGWGAGDRIADGWRLMAGINAEAAERFPGRLMIAEDLRGDPAVTRSASEGGAGFGAQWDAGFVRRVRAALIASSDEARDLDAVAAPSWSTPPTPSGGSSTRSRTTMTRTAIPASQRRSGLATPTAGRPGSAPRWVPPWSSRRPASRCCSRARSLSRAPGSATRSRSTGASAIATRACCSSIATSSACGAMAAIRPAGCAVRGSRCTTSITQAASLRTTGGRTAAHATT